MYIPFQEYYNIKKLKQNSAKMFQRLHEIFLYVKTYLKLTTALDKYLVIGMEQQIFLIQ